MEKINGNNLSKNNSFESIKAQSAQISGFSKIDNSSNAKVEELKKQAQEVENELVSLDESVIDNAKNEYEAQQVYYQSSCANYRDASNNLANINKTVSEKSAALQDTPKTIKKTNEDGSSVEEKNPEYEKMYNAYMDALSEQKEVKESVLEAQNVMESAEKKASELKNTKDKEAKEYQEKLKNLTSQKQELDKKVQEELQRVEKQRQEAENKFDSPVGVNKDGDFEYYQMKNGVIENVTKKDEKNKYELTKDKTVSLLVTNETTGIERLSQKGFSGDSSYVKTTEKDGTSKEIFYNEKGEIETISYDIDGDNKEDYSESHFANANVGNFYYHIGYDNSGNFPKEKYTEQYASDNKTLLERKEDADGDESFDTVEVYNSNGKLSIKGKDTDGDGVIDSDIKFLNTADGKIDTFYQNGIGDCWLLAGIESVNSTEEGRELIKNAIEIKDGKTVVHLSVGDYEITDEELLSGKINQAAGHQILGDDDMLLLELASEKAMNDIADGKIKMPDNINPIFTETKKGISKDMDKKNERSIDNGWENEALSLLTGKTPKVGIANHTKTKYLNEFEQDSGKNISLGTEAAFNKTVTDIYGNEIYIMGNHAYSVRDVKDGIVTVINPHNSSEEIKLDIETFNKSFGDVTKIDLSEDKKENTIYKTGNKIRGFIGI